GLVAGTSLGLLWPGACAGLPEGNCPGGKLAFDGAIRSSSSSIWKRHSCSLRGSTIVLPRVKRHALPNLPAERRRAGVVPLECSVREVRTAARTSSGHRNRTNRSEWGFLTAGRQDRTSPARKDSPVRDER